MPMKPMFPLRLSLSDTMQHNQTRTVRCWEIRRILQIMLPLVRVHDLRPAQSPPPRYLAVLIDGENTPPDEIGTILAEIGRFGTARDRRVYGNWAHPSMRRWHEPSLHYGLHPIHTVPTRAGKNATDIALVVDGMSLVQRGGLHGVCLVASDSDYTPFVTYLRTNGYFVLGIGQTNTPAALIQACTVHRVLEQRGSTSEPVAGTATTPQAQRNGTATATHTARSGDSAVVTMPPTLAAQQNEPVMAARLMKPVSETTAAMPAQRNSHTPDATTHVTITSAQSLALRDLLIAAWQHAPKQDGWLSVTVLGSQLRQLDPTFASKQYGYAKLSQMVQAQTDLLDVRTRGTGQYEIRLRGAS